MPATVLGSGFTGATQLLIGGVSVPFTVTGDGRIEFVTPPGVDGTTVDIEVVTPNGTVTLANAFGYAEVDTTAIDAGTGGVMTTSNGVRIEVPGQGISGTLQITVTPETPPAAQEGRLLMYSFRVEATLDGEPLGVITNALQMKLAVDTQYMRGGWLPWLWEWNGTEMANRSSESERTLRSMNAPATLHSAASLWSQVPGQQYDAVKGEVHASVKTMTHYTVTVRRGLRQWYAWLAKK